MGLVVGIVLVWFVIEMLVWILIAQFISGWYVFFWFIVAAIIGISLMKKTLSVINPMAQAARTGVIPNMPISQNTLAKSVALCVAGLLLFIPGILSDILALILLIPAIQRLLTQKAQNYALNNQAKMMEMMSKQMGGNFGAMGGFGSTNQSPFGGAPFGKSPFGGTTIDGQATDIKTPKKINSANDD